MKTKKFLQPTTYNLQPSSGLGMVEIIVVIAIIISTFTAILQVALFERRSQNLARQNSAAYVLARGTLEATRSIRDGNWSDISSLTYTTPYYLTLSSSANTWELSTSNPGPIDIYTRWIEVSEVFRDGNDDIVTSGTSDADTRHIEAFVSWTIGGGDTRQIDLETYLTNWQNY